MMIRRFESPKGREIPPWPREAQARKDPLGREKLKLERIPCGRALGYEAAESTVDMMIRRFESPKGREIPPWIERLAFMYGRYGIPKQF